ncbi:MAG: hypothetical protein U1A27_06930 [Phycisphaerae bacterium]
MRSKLIQTLRCGLGLLLLCGACAGRPAASVEHLTDVDVARLYGPTKLEILPFTKFSSFDDDAIPDGVAVALRPLDEMGDPTKAYGEFLFELFTYREASAQRAGQRLESWSQSILTSDDQHRFWDRVTSTYVFQLTWEGGQFPKTDQKYVLTASYLGPSGRRLFAEHTFEFRVNRREIRESMGASAAH